MDSQQSPGLRESLLSSSLREHDRQHALEHDSVEDQPQPPPSSSPDAHDRHNPPHRYSASPLMGSPFPYMLRRRSGFQGNPQLSSYDESEAEGRQGRSFDEEVGPSLSWQYCRHAAAGLCL